jgi:hypothetical protein
MQLGQQKDRSTILKCTSFYFVILLKKFYYILKDFCYDSIVRYILQSLVSISPLFLPQFFFQCYRYISVNISVWIRIRGSVILNNGTGSRLDIFVASGKNMLFNTVPSVGNR